jgi:dTDP-4-amino-4,6-dideoxygalactose transaminase
MDIVPFHRPSVVGNESRYVMEAISRGMIGDNGPYTDRCCQFIQDRFDVPKVLLTGSCTAALEIAAILADLEPGDEVIMPSFTFVSTASAFVRVGARPVFIDIRPDTLNIDERLIESAISPRTRAIVPVHYAGVGCDMATICRIARRHRLLVIEDAAQALNARYRDRPLGTIGPLGCFSFHETKNIVAGTGGALCINEPDYIERAEIICRKGTNRAQFLSGLVDRYTWVDHGSSFAANEIVAAFLLAQLERLDELAHRRQERWQRYRHGLEPLESEGLLRLPTIPADCAGNHHIFYLILPDRTTRDGMIDYLADHGVQAVFHFVPLHSSPMGLRLGRNARLPVTDSVSDRILRLPLHDGIAPTDQRRIIELIRGYLCPSVRLAA